MGERGCELIEKKLAQKAADKLRKEARDHKQEKKFFLYLGIVTVILIIVLYLIYS